MSLLDQLKAKASESEYADLENMGKECIGQMESYEFKEDKMKNKALFVQICLEDKKLLVQKYTKTTYQTLFDAISAIGGEKVLKDNMVLWRKQRVGRTTLDRFYPVSIVNKPKK